MAGWTNLIPSAGALASGSAYLYESSGALVYQGTSGSPVTLANANGTITIPAVAYTSYTPTVSNFGTSPTSVTSYTQIGKTIHYYGTVTYASGTPATVTVTLPVNAHANALHTSGVGFTNAGGSAFPIFNRITTTGAGSVLTIAITDTTTSYGQLTGFNATRPGGSWSAGNIFTFNIIYEAA